MGRISYEEDYYNGLAKFYFIGILKQVVKLGNLEHEDGLIFDYGCGYKHIRKLIPNANYIGYDIIKELSDVPIYQNLRPNKILCINVLEHLDENELNNLLDEFKIMNYNHILVVALPTENILSRIGMLMTGKLNAHSDHKLKYKKVNELIEKRYKLLHRKYCFLRMSQINIYKLKESE